MDNVQVFAKGMEQAEVAYWVPMDLIEPDPDQPRKYFDEEGMEELKGSVRENKQRLPIHIRPSPTYEQDRKFIIVSGERRWRVAKQLGHDRMRAFIMLESGVESFNWSFIENYNRRGYTPMEEAQGLRRYVDEGLTQAEIAAKIGRSVAHVGQVLLLNELPIALQEKVATGKLAASTGILLVKECKTQTEMAEVISELTTRTELGHGQSFQRLTTNKVKNHIDYRRRQKKIKESGETPLKASRRELAKCLEPAATQLFGLLDELIAIGEESSEAFRVVWEMIPKPQRAGIEANLRSIDTRIQKVQTYIEATKVG